MYQPYYCEENIWHLCQHVSVRDQERWVVFISNPSRSVALYGQRASQGRHPVIWDYHVVLLARPSSSDWWNVFDLDTTWGFPLTAWNYLTQSFQGWERWFSEYLPMFRVLSAEEYQQIFSSDRSHMRTPDGSFQQPPPSWPCMQGQHKHNLHQFIDMVQPFVGEVLLLPQMFERFAPTKPLC